MSVKNVCRFLSIGFILILIISALGQGPKPSISACDLSLTVFAESANQSNDISILKLNKSDNITLNFELTNNLKMHKYMYDWVEIKYNITNLYEFPLERIRATNSSKNTANGLFSISFNRTKSNNENDFFEIHKNGSLILCCKKFQPSEKILFNFSTQISDGKNSGPYKLAEHLRPDCISFYGNRIKRYIEGIKIKESNGLLILKYVSPNSTTNLTENTKNTSEKINKSRSVDGGVINSTFQKENANSSTTELLTTFLICVIFIILLLFALVSNFRLNSFKSDTNDCARNGVNIIISSLCISIIIIYIYNLPKELGNIILAIVCSILANYFPKKDK